MKYKFLSDGERLSIVAKQIKELELKHYSYERTALTLTGSEESQSMFLSWMKDVETKLEILYQQYDSIKTKYGNPRAGLPTK